MTIKSTGVLGGIVASALLLGSTAAWSDSAPVQREARTMTVQLGNLNLNRAGDVAILYQRLSAAAKRVCSSRAFTGFYYTLSEYRSCVADALREAVDAAQRTSLTAYYLQQQSPSRPIRVAEK